MAPRLRLLDRPVDPRAEFSAPTKALPPRKVEVMELVPRWALLAPFERVVKQERHLVRVR